MSVGAKDFTHGPVFRPLVKLALPIMATSFVQMGYNLTDMAWVGRLGSESVAAIGSVGMLMWLTSSFAILSKIAAEVNIGQSIGAGKEAQASAYASHTTTISIIMAVVVMVILFFGAGPILSFFKMAPHIALEAADYLKIVSTALPFSYLALNFAGIYNGVGRSNIPFYLVSSGLVCNMVLDPLLIFGVDGLFDGLGTRGAAIATWLSQGFVVVLFVWQLRKKNAILSHFPFLIRLQSRLTRRIFRIGLPVALMNLFFALINSTLARIASVYGGHLGISTQTTGGQIEGITWNTSQGFGTALSSFVAQNYAANRMDRAQKAYRYTLSVMFLLGIVVTISFLFFGEQIFGIIIPEDAARIAGGNYLFIIGFSQILMMVELTTQGMFNGMGRTLPPAMVSIVFNLARIPLAVVLASRMGINGVWWAIAISSIIKGMILFIWLSLDLSRKK